jgi:hypothetical protein
MPRSNPGATYRRRSSDRFRSDVQFALPDVVAATVAAGDAFDTSDIECLSLELQIREYLVTAMTGSDNDIQIIAREVGDTDVQLELVDPSANDAELSVVVAGEDITVNLATDSGGTITSTAQEVVDAINDDDTASELVFATVAAGDSGAGVVTALAQTPVAGPAGSTPTMDVTVETMADEANWYSLGTIPQQNAVGAYRKVFGPVGWQTRINLTLGGTASPAFALSTYVIGHA